jgi:hypothetical protein
MPLIHQIVLGTSIPSINKQCLDSWRALETRGFTFVSWTNGSAEDYLANCPVGEAKALYERARNYGEASDILRIAITYGYGGLYVDWDVLLVDPDRFLAVMPDFESSNCVLLKDPHTKEPDFSCTYDNSLLYLRQGNVLALDFLREMERNYSSDPVPDTPFVTGPLALTRFLDSQPHYKNDCRMVDTLDIYSFDYADVIEYTKGGKGREVLKTHVRRSSAPAIHLWTHAWVPKRKWSRRVVDRISRTFRMATRAR